jgi:hypothetical protein
MLPDPARSIHGSTCFVQKNTPLTFTFWTASHSSSVSSCVGLFAPEIPALLTRTSILPKASAISRKTLRMSDSLATSARQYLAVPPARAIAAASSPPFSSRRSTIATRAPSRAREKLARRTADSERAARHDGDLPLHPFHRTLLSHLQSAAVASRAVWRRSRRRFTSSTRKRYVPATAGKHPKDRRKRPEPQPEATDPGTARLSLQSGHAARLPVELELVLDAGHAAHVRHV